MSSVSEKRVLVTRSDEDCAEWAAKLEAAGAHVVMLPCIRTEPIDNEKLRDRVHAQITDTDWLVFTSRRGVAAFASLLKNELPTRVKIAVVGPATADTAVIAFGHADLVSEAGTAASLAQALETRITEQGNVLLALAENADETIEQALAPTNCTRLSVYRTIPVDVAEPKCKFSALGADTVLLASPSAVQGFTNQVELDKPAAIFTIGPATNAAAQTAGLDVTGQALTPSLEGLMEAIECAT